MRLINLLLQVFIHHRILQAARMHDLWREMQHLRAFIKVFNLLLLTEHAAAIQVIGASLDWVRRPFQVACQLVKEITAISISISVTNFVT